LAATAITSRAIARRVMVRSASFGKYPPHSTKAGQRSDVATTVGANLAMWNETDSARAALGPAVRLYASLAAQPDRLAAINRDFLWVLFCRPLAG
jgi:hypothetical protein